MAESVQIIMRSLETMDIWKLIIIGVLGLWALKILIKMVGTIIVAIFFPWEWKKKLKDFHWNGVERAAIPLSARLLGLGIVFLAVGAGIVVTLVIPITTGWGIFGALLVSCGLGLVLFYFITSKAEQQH